MGRIKKAATERHLATLSPFVSDFVKRATEIPLHQLPSHLDSFPQHWPLPRGDLYHWIQLLDRFDHILERFNKEYALSEGPQVQPFESRLLQMGDAEEGMPYPSSGSNLQELGSLGYSQEGDRELVEALLRFTRVLLEHCGNRSLYASSTHISNLLHTTSLSLLRLCLKLSLRLAQRYQVARYKNHHPSAQAVLLANHYNLNLDNMHKLAMPFPKPYNSGPPLTQTPGKAKEKASSIATTTSSSSSTTSTAFNPSDLVAIAKDPMPANVRAELSNVALTYYEHSSASVEATMSTQWIEGSPSTPTPTRRPSNLGPSRDRSSVEDRSASTNNIRTTSKSLESDVTSSTALKLFHIPGTKVAETPAWLLVREALPNVPSDMRYDLLNRIRISKAFASPNVSCQQLLEIRLLAIANLAYALAETKFQEKIGLPDAEEPRRFHLASQLCDLLQPATNGQTPLTLQSEATIIMTLEGLTKSRHKVAEVADGLAITVNHGILYYGLRKVIATLDSQEHDDRKAELLESEWRDATFDLVNSLLQSNTQARYGEKMVSAGIMAILVEALKLRTSRAERFYEKVLQFFDSFVHGIPTAFQTLAGVKGLDVIADLTAFEVDAALENAHNSSGLPLERKSKVVDYEIPFYQQSTLRQLFKNTVHMFEHNAGTHDRLLRNLIDTPQILGALQKVIQNAHIFGSNVWSGAINIVSSFIHNEPTSYQVIGEAGLSKGLLESIIGEKLPEELPSLDELTFGQNSEKLEVTNSGEPKFPSIDGILPVCEVMCDIPTAFGAICLNEAGMHLFQASGALFKYFDIFLSPVHVRAMEDESQTAGTIGHSFDELSRHHPRLKDQIMAAIFNMLRRLRDLCEVFAVNQRSGAKLWHRVDGKLCVAGGEAALKGIAATDVNRAISATQEAASVGDSGDENGNERAPAIPYLTACFKFLEGFFHNSTMCSLFCDESGAEIVLDLAASPSVPYDLVAFPLFSKITQVLKSMCEAKPHLVLPSIIRRAQCAIAGLKTLTTSETSASSFAKYIDLSESADTGTEHGLDGTSLLKSLVNAHLLTHVLGRALAPPAYTLRHGSQNNHVFMNFNFTEVYLQLIDDLSKLHATCVWEALLLMRDMSDQQRADSEPRPFVMRRIDAYGVVELAADKNADAVRSNGGTTNGVDNTRSRDVFLAQKNLKAIRYLLSQVPMGIESFFHSLGQAIVTKRMDSSAKQHAIFVADRLAQALTWELDYRRSESAEASLETKYTASMLTMIGRMLLRNSYSMEAFGTKEALTLVLTKFYLANGFAKVNGYLERFVQLLAKQQEEDKVEGHVKDAIQSVLNFYGQVVRPKCINDATQSNVIAVRDKTQPDYFQPGQFLVEVRHAVLPAVDRIWHSKDIEKLTDANMRSIVDILRLILKAESEERALRRNEHASRRVLARTPEFKLRNTNGLDRLVNVLHFDRTLSREAIYRCNNNSTTAEAYCRLRLKDANVPRFPIPEGEAAYFDIEANANGNGPDTSGEDRPDVDMASTAEEQDSVEITDPNGHSSTEPALLDADNDDQVVLDNDLGSDDDDINMGTLGQLPADLRAEDLQAMGDRHMVDMLNSMHHGLVGKDTREPFVTVDDLDESRDSLRRDLIDRCLDVLSTQSSLTFELSDLIQAAVAKAGEGATPRADIGTILVSSLMSLQGEDSSKEAGLKIHAHAHLVALLLQDRDFFDSTLDELKEYFENLVQWVKLEPDQKAEDAPWIDTVLLIVERVLAEDEQPVEITWEPPSPENPLKSIPLPPLPEPVVTQELRSQLFDALVDLLPKIGKNATLALSVSRVLAIITRRRDLAARLSDKHTLGRLFMMIRQLAGSVDDKLQSTFMLILRHMIEDDDTVRQIMRGEIKVAFDNHRSSRPMETTTYTRNLYHLVLRSPTIFVEITDEMLEIVRFDGNPHRAQSLALKKEKASTNGILAGSSDAVPEGAAPEAPKVVEAKPPPSVESTNGVIQFLLRELSTYRDVEDKSSPEAASSDVQMSDSPGNANGSEESPARSNKPGFKAEEHIIYIYRCFILQCLAELLACYNNTKIEFINFSRKPETQPATPSKPRAGTLNYLLNTLLPVGTLEHRDDVAYRKKVATSNWATSVLASLCTKTQERPVPGTHTFATTDFAEQEPELTFVRKFVLDHALRSFKEATASPEPLDQRYSRLLVLGELFNRMLNDKVDVQRSNVLAAGNFNSHQQMGRLMYEKNFIGTLTSAIAELDLNFPNAKRAVKYILAPLKQLTELGVNLSQTTDLSSSTGVETSADEEDEISSATSVEEEDEREQTPDLFRGSSLGMLEGGGRDDDESDSEDDDDEEDDDEMYDEAYDEEMDYEDDQVAEHGDVVSDDDDELAGIGPIEGLPGDVQIEVDMTMDEGDGDDSDNDDDDEDDDMSDEDEDDPDGDVEFPDHMDEVTGDDENASIGEHDDEHDWEDDGMDYEAIVPAHDGGSPPGGPLEQLAHVLGGEDPSDLGDHDGLVRIDMGGAEEEFFEDEMAPEDDDEEEEGEFGEDIVYEPEMEDDEDEDPSASWAWDIRPPAGAMIHGHHHHHHHHHRGFNEMLGMLGADPLRSAGHIRTHRSTPNGREEDGINPLLQRDGNSSMPGRDRDLDSLGIPRFANRRTFLPRHGESVLQDLVAAVGAPGAHGVINVNVEPGGVPGLGALPSMFTVHNGPGGAMIDLDPPRPWRDYLGRWPDMAAAGRLADRASGNSGNSEAQAVDFHPTSTSHRWQEEARLLFPGKFHEKATRIINMLFNAMVPAAMEARRIREKEEAERRAAEQKAADEARKKLEAEKAEREALEKKEREEREAREREEAEARAREEAERAAEDGHEQREDTNMEGVEQEPQPASTSAEGQEAAPAANETPSERVMITLRGREVDITTLGIDREYIEALPEEMREEVVMTQLAEQRQQQVDSGERPSEISREFLDALPREIQQELLRSEQMERRRRERDEARRRAAPEGAAAQPEEMNNADFMAMLDPNLRQAVLMDADEAVLASLPEDLQAEARALFSDRRAPRGDHAGRGGRGLDFPAGGVPGVPNDEGRESSRPRRPVAQMLDKAGVATLLRLMFVSLNHKSKTHLRSILSDVCKNTQNRAEVISILLSILQDGTADVNAVERSFAQLSLRAKQPSAPKTPQPLRRTLTGQAAVTPSTELSPLNIVQQCLGTLNALANDNSRVQSFFLNEHETVTSQKAKSAKKGKAKENKAVKFPLNALLALLDRKLITENTAVMETLASLLSHVTRPLTLLIRRAREAQEAEKAAVTASKEAEGAREEHPQTSASDVPMQEAAPAESGEVAQPSANAGDDAPDTTAEPRPETIAAEEAKKKHRDLSPPDVPDENIRLVVNILAARECPSKTFSDTLDIIKNLSAIPGAKEVFGKELIRQAQELGHALLMDLDELAKQINGAQTGTEVQGMALASFSSAASKQRKLLRVLVALDHLFDSKRTPTVESATMTSSGIDQKLKDDVLASLYESSTFDKLWHGLSVCLTAIRQRGNMVNVATILLPLIESLMVVCRNSALKDAPASLATPWDVKSAPTPEARMDALFFNFTEEHRKILNELIRNNPKLMNGNLSPLAKNSKVLEFDNKRNYFSRKLHDRRSEARVAHPSLQLSVRRDQVFLDSFKSLYYKSGNEIKYGKLNIRFHGEEGIDAGGVSREWFGAMARQMFNGDYALFNRVASDRTTFHPNSFSEVNPEHLMFFKFIGRIIGKALYENRVLDCHFSRAVYRKILGKSVSLKDMETLDLDYYKSLVWILENDITDVTFETFSVDVDRFGSTETIDLIPNGRERAVTEENKQEYVQLVVDFRLIKSVQAQLDNFLEGFHEIIPSELVSIFNEQELELLISGLPDIDVEDWKNNSDYHNYQPTSPQIQWFWRAVRSFDKEEKAKLLQFVTGTSKVPLNGFKELEGMNGFAKFNIHRDYSSKEKLPSSHTCFNQLDLPEYESYESLRQQLYTAITAGSEYFGFA